MLAFAHVERVEIILKNYSQRKRPIHMRFFSITSNFGPRKSYKGDQNDKNHIGFRAIGTRLYNISKNHFRVQVPFNNQRRHKLMRMFNFCHIFSLNEQINICIRTLQVY